MMKTQGNARGSALVGALGGGVVLTIVCLGTVGSVLNESSRVRNNERETQASYIASGALDLFLSGVIPQPSLLREPTEDLLAGEISGGTFTVGVGQLDTTTAMVTATGNHEGVSRSMRAYIRTNVFMGRGGFDKAIFADDDLDVVGNVSVEGGGVHTNADASLSGSAYDIDGDLSAVGTIGGNTSGVTGTVTPGADQIEFPELDIQRYCDIAVANSQVLVPAKANQEVRLSGTYRPTGGVLWIKGSARINANTAVHGCLIVAGNLTINGKSLTQYQRDDVAILLPGVIVYNGDLKANGTAVVEGLVYCPTNGITLGGNLEVEGAVYSRSTIKGHGNPSVVYNQSLLDFTDPDNPAREVAEVMAIERW